VFGITRDDIAAPVKIASYSHPSFMSPYGSHFEEVDILGTDFMTNYNVVMWPDWDTKGGVPLWERLEFRAKESEMILYYHIITTMTAVSLLHF
jgi:hypothetical protein